MPGKKSGSSFRIGKIPPAVLLRTVYRHAGRKNPRLLFGPGIGIDAAAVKYGKQVMVFKSDPVTGTASHIGSHSVHVNANDIATTGARPVWYLATILLPLGSGESALAEIMDEIDDTCRDLGISLIGGHCEVTRGISRSIIVGFMVGETQDKILTTRNARVGDSVLLTKTAGLEGTAILASDYAQDLRLVEKKVLSRALGFSKQISVVREALSIANIDGVHALHDPTEGGVLNGFWEIAEASGLGIEIYADKIPVAEETRILCSKLRLNPLKLMSSGSLIVATAPASVPAISRVFRNLGVRLSEVGRLFPSKNGRWLLDRHRKMTLGPVVQDELYKL